ncbi:phage tail tape measure protein [Caulobacter endophyticus]|uniref:Phage tail tape measure protein n=1 Tax=Caulobacter endophyticus TaxID=2172652 RepID=A0A2T9K466_9CAUL|nr:phage tail tape measure protein [Caulobacter endophyticus]PVM90765.1 phage tail tape measure protein [Caulobacter endophyticus]
MSGFDELEGLPLRTAEAGEALASLEAPARAAARSIEEVFAVAGASLARSLSRAAADGEVSLGELARAVLGAVSGGGRSGGGGLGEALGAALSGAFSGARAEGGPVTGGGAYLVGERGPEVFRPAGAGTIEAAGGGGISVTVQVSGGDAGGLARSDAQLAQALARAVSLGARRL